MTEHMSLSCAIILLISIQTLHELHHQVAIVKSNKISAIMAKIYWLELQL